MCLVTWPMNASEAGDDPVSYVADVSKKAGEGNETASKVRTIGSRGRG